MPRTFIGLDHDQNNLLSITSAALHHTLACLQQLLVGTCRSLSIVWTGRSER